MVAVSERAEFVRLAEEAEPALRAFWPEVALVFAGKDGRVRKYLSDLLGLAVALVSPAEDCCIARRVAFLKETSSAANSRHEVAHVCRASPLRRRLRRNAFWLLCCFVPQVTHEFA